MRTMRQPTWMFAVLVGIWGAVAAPPALAADPKEPPWVKLFDGKTLAGWTQRGGAAKYEVKDGAIVGSSVPNTPNSFLSTDRSYGDFVLELEFKVDERLNSGIQIRGQSRPDYRDGLVHGYQIEIDPDVKRNRMWTGGLYDEKRRGWLVDLKDNEAARLAFKADKWNKLRIEAMGSSIKTWLNGVPAVDTIDPVDLEGFIGLQVHGVGKREEPLVVAWRNIRIQDHGRHAWRPLWDEKTLTGLHPAGGGAWTVENGVIVGTNQKREPRHGLLFVEGMPGDFILRAEVRAASGNGGLYFAAKASETPAGATGLQVDIDASGAGAIYETGGRGFVARPGEGESKVGEKASKSWKPGDWNRVSVVRNGGTALAYVNDLPAARIENAAGPDDRVALEVNAQQDVRLEVRALEVLSERIPPPVPGYPIGWCILPDGTAPDDAKALQYEFVEVAYQKLAPLSDEAFAAVVARYQGLGLDVKSAYNVIPKELKLVGPDVPADGTVGEAELGAALPRLAALGTEFLVFNAGESWRVPEGFDSKQALAQLTSFSRRLAAAAKKHGMMVLVQPLRAKDSNLIVGVEEAANLVRAVRHPNFRMLVDNSFMAIQSEDPKVLAKARGLVKHVWLADPTLRTYPMGQDPAAYAEFFAMLKRIGYRGGLSVHARTDNPRADAPRAQRFLRKQAEALAGKRRWVFTASR